MNLTEDFARQLAMRALQAYPEVLQNNPRAQELASLIQSNDANRGMQVANNLCNSYGTSREDALSLAGKFFGF